MEILTAAMIFLWQADAGSVADSSQAPVPGAGTGALVEMLHNTGLVAWLVLILLAIASLYSWNLIFSKASLFSKATKESRQFVQAFRKATRLQEVAEFAAICKFSPLAQVFEEIYETYKRQTGGAGPPRNLGPLERSGQTAASESITHLERRLSWLATIASVSPFVGLFGTVVGIIDAFHGLGTAGAATLRAVAPGISEALITTAAGLFVAVPAVIAYNQFSARIRVFASAVDDFCRELLNSLEEIPPRNPVAARSPNPAPDAVREADRGLYK